MSFFAPSTPKVPPVTPPPQRTDPAVQRAAAAERRRRGAAAAALNPTGPLGDTSLAPTARAALTGRRQTTGGA